MRNARTFTREVIREASDAIPRGTTPRSRRTPNHPGSGEDAKAKSTFKSLAEQQKAMERQRLHKLRERRRMHAKKVARAVRLCLYLFLTIASCLCIGQAIYLVWMMGTTTFSETSSWLLHPLPVSNSFETFGVSSNSETCNELARTLFLDGFGTYELALAVAVCLAASEPHQSTVDGMGVLIKLNISEGVCNQAVVVSDNSSEVISPESIFEALAGELSDEGLERVRQRLLDHYYPVSRSFAEFLRKKNTEMVLNGTFDYLFDEERNFATPVEGDLFDASTTITSIFNRIVGIRKAMELFADDSYWMKLNMTSLPRNRTACGPSLGGKSTLFLEKFKGYAERVRLEELEMEDNITLVEKMESLYDIAPKLINSILRPLKKPPPPYRSRRRGVRRKWVPPYTGNFFAIMDKRQGGVVMAYAQTSRDVAYAAFYQPLIVVDDSLKSLDLPRQLVWAGPGGDTNQSMELPRMAHALALNLMYDVPIDQAVTSPIMFAFDTGGIYFTDGIPVRRLLKSVKSLNAAIGLAHVNLLSISLGRGNNLYRRDAVSAIQTTENGTILPVCFDSSGAVIFPNGV